MNVLLTGATGFIGSYIGDVLCEKGHQLICTKRQTSNLQNTQKFKAKTIWIDTDNDDWVTKAIEAKPDVILHSAWIGVTSSERKELNVQIQNLELLSQLLLIARSCGCKRFIGLGSQAEYGNVDFPANEKTPVKPGDAYGLTKVLSSQMIQYFCDQNHIEWFWLRLYSFFGERESDHWLIPSMVKKMMTSDLVELTPGEQQYDYLYAGDLAESICKLIDAKVESGVFIISSSRAVKIKDLMMQIRDMVNPACRLCFGAIPYRQDQSMFIHGDATKYELIFGKIEKTDFISKLCQVVQRLIAR